MGIIKEWKVTLDEIDDVVTLNPSLRGFLFGYLNEYKLQRKWFTEDHRIQGVMKYDNHDRKHKGDIAFNYNGFEIKVECKSLQTNSIKSIEKGYVGRFQCDASDRRPITLPDGTVIETTCLLVGEFDLLAVGIFNFVKEWKFAFAKNSDLPRTKYKKYKPEYRKYLLAGTMEITWPLTDPFKTDPFSLLDEIILEKQREI